jgi:hypothetical protein
MKDADRTIERLLSALRDAEPSAAMAHRILQAMEAREAEASTPRWPRLRPVATWLAAAVAITGILIVAVAVHQQRRAPADTSSRGTAPHGTVPLVRRTNQPEAVVQKASMAPRRPAKRGSRRPPVSTGPETEAASFPAPPLPLTEQERLLLRLAHRRNPEDTAILNPAVQAVQSAKTTEQFQHFFGIDAIQMRSQIE